MAPMIDSAAATRWLDRYQAGEHEIVWAEMTSIGPDVRSKPYLEPAWAVAQETMRRARHNIETIVRRLDQIGYQFWDGRHGPADPQPMRVSIGGKAVAFSSVDAFIGSVMERDLSGHSPKLRQQLESMREQTITMHAKLATMRQATIAPRLPITSHLEDDTVFLAPEANTAAMIRKLEKAGMILPLSLKAWAEAVGNVNLSGAHPTLCFWRDENFPGVLADPLMISLDDLMFQGEEWLDSHREGDATSQIDVMLGYDANTKADLAVVDEQIDGGYDIRLPAANADAVLRNEPHQTHFVDCLRLAFRWGGFPGWENEKTRPEKELRFLSEGLLPI